MSKFGRSLVAVTLAALAVVCAKSFGAIPHNVHVNADVQNGKFDSSDLTRDPSADVAWLTVAAQSKPSGTSYSVNVRTAYLLDAGGASVITVTGCTLPTGWSFSANTLSYSGTGTGAATCQLTATLSGTPYPSNSFTVSASGGDTLAPSIPANLVCASATNAVSCTWDRSTDQNDGTNNGSGVKEYDLSINGGTPVVIADPDGGIITAPTAYNVGAISSPSAPTAVQSGSQWTITAAGTGIDGTSDQLEQVGWSITGDFIASVCVSSFTGSGNIYASAGIMARASSAVGAQYKALYQWQSASSQGVQNKWRAVTDGAKTTGSNVAGTNSQRCVRTQRQNSNTSSETWTDSYSTDGTTYVVLGGGPLNLQLPATLIVGPYATSMLAGTNDTAVFQNWSLTKGQASYTYSTASAITAKVRARDLKSGTPNVSAYGAVVNGTPSVVSSSAKRHHTGFYLLSADIMKPGVAGYSNAYLTSRPTYVVGWMQFVYWSTIESSTSPGTYDFTQLDTLASLAQANGVYFGFSFLDRSFGSENPLPSYLTTAGTGGQTCVFAKSSGVMNRIWDPKCMDREIAIEKAIFAHFESNPYFEGLESEESDKGTWSTTPSDYSAAGYLTQLKRMVTEVTPSAGRANYFVKTNFFPAQSQMVDYIATIDAAGASLSNSDVKANGSNGPCNESWGQRVLHGYVWDGGLTNSCTGNAGGSWTTTGGHSYVHHLSSNADVQNPDMGGGTGHPTFAQLYDQIHTYENEERVFIERKQLKGANCKATDGSNCGPQLYYDASTVSTSQDGTGGRTASDIKTNLNTSSFPLDSTCPANYTAGCTPP